MAHTVVDVTRLAAQDPVQAAQVLGEMRTAALGSRQAGMAPRAVIEESWSRVLRSGLDPDREPRIALLGRDEIERRRQESPLRHVVPVLRETLLSVAEPAHHIMVVADAEGRVLWREGGAPVLRRADGMGLEVGADWSEEALATNGVGTPLVARRPVQVFSGEHFVRALLRWTCAGAPINDPRDGRLLGIVNVSGPLEAMHPTTLAWVDSLARLAEARLRELHLTSLERLRAVAAPLMARMDGSGALAVDRDGWTAAVASLPYTPRVVLPASLSAGRGSVPGLGPCAVEPLPGGWLLRPQEPPAEARAVLRMVLDVSRPRHWTVTVSGETGDWTHVLSLRHAELLCLLALDRAGRTASTLAGDLFGDPRRTVTVRAELSRMRRYLGSLLAHRPYRLHEDAEVEVRFPADRGGLLPPSTAPGVVRARAAGPGGTGPRGAG
ncbi:MULTISPECIES: GAF domain-containing protein [unclassified Streptomyces]|uniref:GAF domain-containing protein n=1 Tax=unclassified Streptomyces TaxID=2593676 RepID=UPI001F316F46|nr:MULTISPECIES: GAF domain-containing protein [unclassified Streptomyces]MCF0086887.1 Acetoin dehydrogenase operon transcriptional activator AcoR [Streptomyces sp. MH192]MCF0099328.1 Acetoin dehydrogenase operon transcriptional activator AcoR [Streptomyces sp. MH191]